MQQSMWRACSHMWRVECVHAINRELFRKPICSLDPWLHPQRRATRFICGWRTTTSTRQCLQMLTIVSSSVHAH